MYYVYMLKCFRGKRFWLYTGYTNNLEKRVEKHKAGTGAKFTKTFKGNIELAYYEEYETKSEAMSREWFIKHKMSRKDKINLISAEISPT